MSGIPSTRTVHSRRASVTTPMPNVLMSLQFVHHRDPYGRRSECRCVSSAKLRVTWADSNPGMGRVVRKVRWYCVHHTPHTRVEGTTAPRDHHKERERPQFRRCPRVLLRGAARNVRWLAIKESRTQHNCENIDGRAADYVALASTLTRLCFSWDTSCVVACARSSLHIRYT